MPVETRYFRSDNWTVNGLTARKLQTTNSTASSFFEVWDWDTLPVYLTVASVAIRNANGTETLIGSNVAQMTRTEDGEGYQTASWSCPQTNLPSQSALLVRMTVQVGGNTATGFWITEQLSYARIDATTWNFVCSTRRFFDGEATVGEFYFGSSTYNSRIENISFSTSSASTVSGTATGSISSHGEAKRFVKATTSLEGRAVLSSQATALLRAFAQAAASANSTGEAYALIKALRRVAGSIVLQGTALHSAKGLLSASGEVTSHGEAFGSVKARKVVEGAILSSAEAFTRFVVRGSGQGAIFSGATAVLRARGRRTAFGSISLQGSSTAIVKRPFMLSVYFSELEVVPVFASKLMLLQSGGDGKMFYAGEDLLISYRAKNRLTGLYETSLPVFLTSVKSDTGEEFVTEPIALTYNVKTKRYEAVFRIPDGVKGKLTFTVKAFGDTVDVEKKSITVR